MPTTVPELIDIETLAKLLGDSVRHVRRLVAERRIPYLKVGHFIRFDPDEIAIWLNAQRVAVEGRAPVGTSKANELSAESREVVYEDHQLQPLAQTISR